MHKQKRRSNRTGDDDDEFDYGEEPEGRAREGGDEDGEEDGNEDDAAGLADDDDDPQPLDRLVKLKWRN